MAAKLRIADHTGHMTGCRVYICRRSARIPACSLRMRACRRRATVVGEGGDGGACLADVKDSNASLVLLDVNMPGVGGLDVLPRLRELLDDDVKIVVPDDLQGARDRALGDGAGR